MAYVIGVDVGTSSTKSIVMDEYGLIKAQAQKPYNFDVPEIGFAEQDPFIWVSAVKETILESISMSFVDGHEIKGISFSGQMHGLVPLDDKFNVIRKAIIWCDQRSISQVDEVRDKLSLEVLGSTISNNIMTGSVLSSLLWMKDCEPENYKKIAHVLLPKDFVRFQLTGNITTDITDAAGTLLFDVKKGKWSKKIASLLNLRDDFLPKVLYPFEIDDYINTSVANELGINSKCKIVVGGADQAMQALGNGILKPGLTSITIGTGGQVLTPLTFPGFDKNLSTHTFNYLTENSWYFLGASLAAGLSLKWLKENILSHITYKQMDVMAGNCPCGSEGVYFLPYLIGDRTPNMDARAKAMFFGLRINHDRSHLIKSVLEGVVYSIRESVEISKALTNQDNKIIASGGGSSSALWLQIQADILGQEIYVSKMKEQAAVGAAINALVGISKYDNYIDACNQIVKWTEDPIRPQIDLVKLYDEKFQIYKQLYKANRNLMNIA